MFLMLTKSVNINSSSIQVYLYSAFYDTIVAKYAKYYYNLNTFFIIFLYILKFNLFL